MSELPEKLAPIQVQTPQGASVTLGGLWEKQAVVIVFLRHFGCLFCRGQVAHMKPHLPAIRAAGAEMVVIGSGTPFYAQGFIEDFHPDCPVFVDPKLEAYAAAGMRRGIGTVMNPQAALQAVKFLAQGHLQGSTQGDPWQEGGVLIVTPPGKLAYSYISQYAGDHPEPDAVMAALKTAVA